MESYLSSFGASPTPADAERHEVFKRSNKRKVKKTKKVSTTTTESSFEAAIPTKPLVGKDNGKNFTVSPRHIVKFELDDAKYSEEYEKLRQSRKLRVKRSSDFGNKTSEKFVTKDTFRQPKEFFRFSYLDAVTKSPLADASDVKEMKESDKKNKREIADSTATETKKIHVSSPMRGYRSSKHVAYDDISSKLQKMIDSALHDAVAKGIANEGDYLKFFYGDKIIKVPVAMSKYLATKSKEIKTTTSATVYGKNVVSYSSQDESSKSEPKLLTTKNAYYPLINTGIKFDTQPKFLPTIPPTSDKAESYANFESPIVVPQEESPESNYVPYKKSVYFYNNNDDSHYPKNSMTSPGPVVFEDSLPTTPSTIDLSKSHFKSYIFHPPSKHSQIKEIPIMEHVNEGYEYTPEKYYRAPTSYIEFAGNHGDLHDTKKNYEFGYVLRHTLRR